MRSTRLALIGLLTLGCGGPATSDPPRWRQLDRFSDLLPDGIRVEEYIDPSLPLRAWCVRARVADPSVSVRLEVATDRDLRETTSTIARKVGACVAVNAGFFTRDTRVAEHQGLLLVDGHRRAPLRDPAKANAEVYGTRAAIGVLADGSIDVAWIAERDGQIVEWPSEETGMRPGPEPEAFGAWSPMHGMQGGQAVVMRGKRCSPGDQAQHPRTAAGVTEDGELVLLVADGRQRRSRGLTLKELGEFMVELGCVEALNLDGGGSSTLVVAGERLNRPQGWPSEREVMTVLGLFCSEE